MEHTSAACVSLNKAKLHLTAIDQDRTNDRHDLNAHLDGPTNQAGWFDSRQAGG
jgi:hypothetical protein